MRKAKTVVAPNPLAGSRPGWFLLEPLQPGVEYTLLPDLAPAVIPPSQMRRGVSLILALGLVLAGGWDLAHARLATPQNANGRHQVFANSWMR